MRRRLLQEPLLLAPAAAVLGDHKAAVEGAGYEAGAGFIKLPYAKDLPIDLLKSLMAARVEEYEATSAGWNHRD